MINKLIEKGRNTLKSPIHFLQALNTSIEILLGDKHWRIKFVIIKTFANEGSLSSDFFF